MELSSDSQDERGGDALIPSNDNGLIDPPRGDRDVSSKMEDVSGQPGEGEPEAAPFVEEEHHAVDALDPLDPSLLPLPKEYARGDGNELTYSFTLTEASSPEGGGGGEEVRSKRPVYHSLVVYPDDELALCMDVECDQTQKYCTISVAPDNAVIGKKSFAEFFEPGATLKPFYSSIVRICLCPMHNKLVMASLLMDAVKSTVALPNVASSASGQAAAAGGDAAAAGGDSRRGWRVVVENGDGFIRFFHVERTKACFCDFPVLFTT